MTAIALHNAPAADRALEASWRRRAPDWLRSDTAVLARVDAEQAGRPAAHPDARSGSQRQGSREGHVRTLGEQGARGA